MNAPDRLVADAADRVFSRVAAGDPGFDASLWRSVRESGLARILSDGELADAVSVLRAAGYRAAAVPVCEAILGQWLAQRAGFEYDEALTTVALGTRPIALDLAGGTASGSLPWVPWGRHAAAVYTEVTGEGILRLSLSAASIEAVESLAGEPRDRVRVDSAIVRRMEGTSGAQALAMGALLRAAQMNGAMEAALDLALEHAGTRRQFGRAIGKFQAVQQMLALLASHAAAATAAVDLAVASWADGAGTLAAGIAKSRAGEAATVVGEMAHQVIAAMGFTREHPLHRFTRRLWAWRDEFGSEAFWNRRLGAALLASGGSGVWPLIAGGRDTGPSTVAIDSAARGAAA